MRSLVRLLPHSRCNVLAMLHVPALPGEVTFRQCFFGFKIRKILTPSPYPGSGIFIHIIYLFPSSSNILYFTAGTPASSMGMSEILDKVGEETEIYLKAGVDGLILENMHDTPYCLEHHLGPHIGASMAVVARQVQHPWKFRALTPFNL